VGLILNKFSAKVGAHGKLSVSTLLLEERSPSLVLWASRWEIHSWESYSASERDLGELLGKLLGK
jgi:hypothetical protein